MRSKKILSLLLAMTMLLSCVGITAMAEGSTTVTNSKELDNAIKDEDVTEIVLGGDIDLSDLLGGEETSAVAKVNGTEYATFADAVAAATEGDTITILADTETFADAITLPANITLNGNGKQINGTIYAGGDLTFEGYTKVTNFNAGYNRPVIAIGEGACLELTGSGRMVIGHGATFNITGTISDAKTANVAELTPSLVIPGASFTGNSVNFNVTNAYIKAAYYCSSSSSASGTFDFDITNSVWEQTNKLAFEAQSVNATVNFDLKDSVLTTTSHLLFSVSKGAVVIDNSIVNEGVYRQLENRSNLTIKNGSVVYASVQVSSNAINPGTLIVDNAKYITTGEFSGVTVGTGKLVLKNGATATVPKFGNATVEIGAGCTLTTNHKSDGEFTITPESGYEVKFENGVYTTEKGPIAQIGDTIYTDIQEALKVLKANDTLTLLADITVDYYWDARYTGGKITVPVTIDGDGHKMTFTNTVYDGGNHFSVFRFEKPATVKNLTIDMTNAVSGFNGRFRAISSKDDLTVEKCTFIGNGSANNTRAIIFGEGAGNAISDVEVTVTDSTFIGWRRGVSDNENAQDAATVKIDGNTFTDSDVYVSASTSVNFNNNNMSESWANIQSYAKENSTLSIVAQGNTLSENSTSKQNVVKNFETADVQEGFIIPAKTYQVATKAELDEAIAKAADGDIILLTDDIDYTGTATLKIEKAITLDLGGNSLTTYGTYGGLILKGDCYLKNGTLSHKGTVTAIKAWNVKAIEDLVIDVAFKAEGKTIGGIVIQENAAGIDTIKNVTIKGEGLTNGIETYNCGNATSPVIGSMENVTIDATGTAMNISAPVGTATGCTFKGGVNGIELWIKGTYSATLDLKGCTVDGGEQAIFIHDEFTSNTGAVNNGTLKLTADDTTTFGNEKLVMVIARAENVEIDEDILKMRSLQSSGAAENPYIINNLNDLKWFREDVNAGDTYKGKYVKLADDIDLKDEEWTPIAKFEGVFDGNNKTISNLVVNGAGKSNQGFFAETKNGEIKNVTFNNAKVTGRLNVGVVAGTPYTSKYINIKITGHVEVNGMSYVGGVGGKNAYADWTDITVDVDDTSYVKATSTENGKAYRTYVGGVIGFMGEGGHTVKNVTSNINVIGDVCDIGGIVGIAHYGNNFENVVCAGNVTNTNADAADSAETGGIAGVWHNQQGYTVTFTNCSFTGKVTATGVAENTAIGAAYNAENNSESTSGSLVIDGETAWPKPAYVAQVGDKYYLTLEDAIAAAEEGDTITLLDNIALTEGVTVPAGKTITLDLAGKTITGTPVDAKAFAVITNKGELTIIGEGSIVCDHQLAGSTSYAVNTITNSGKLTVENGVIENKSTASNQIGYAIDNNSTTGNAVVTVNGGEIKVSGSNYYDGIRQFCNSTTLENSVTVAGGSVSSIWMQNPSDGASDRNTKDVKGSVAVTGGNVGGLYLEPSTAFTASVTGGEIGTLDYFEKSEGRDLAGFVTGGTFGTKPDDTYAKDGFEFTANAEGKYEVTEKAELFEFYQMNLDLESSMKVNFYILADYFKGTDYYAEIVHSSANGDIKERVDFADWGNNNSYKQISYTGLVAKNMADTITITIYDATGAQVSVAQEASIKTYAESYIRENAGKGDKWVTSFVDMLNYGAAAQQYFGYNTENLANAGIEQYQIYATENDVELQNIAEVFGPVYKANLDLENRIVYNGYFENVTSDMTAEINYTNHSGKQIITPASIVKSGSYYKVAVDSLVIADANQLITITVKNDNGEIYAYIKDTVNSYLYRAIQAETEPKKFEPLAKAMAKFTASAHTALHTK